MGLAVEDYVVRISNATPANMVVISYELILDCINEAKQNISDTKIYEINVDKARDFLNELRLSLDMGVEISAELMLLYNFIDQKLAYAFFSRDAEKRLEPLEECEKLLNILLEGWKSVEKDSKDQPPMMANTQQLYAGLTYGRNGKLNDYIDVDVNRGYKA